MSYPQETFTSTQLSPGSLIKRRRDAVATNTLLYQLNVLRTTGRYDAFKLEWHSSYDDAPDVWPVPNHLFWDSDIAKWIEGACYFLHDHQNTEVETAISELVDMIRKAQQPDGYLNIHYTVVEPGQRFTNLRDMHEMYNLGHLIEAALAHHNLYKNELLLEPILKYVELLNRTFGPSSDQKHGYPGHPEIELALLRLYRRTGDTKHLNLANYFIAERGNPKGEQGKHYFVVEAEARGDDPLRRPAYWSERDCLWYYQAHKPIIQQESIEGHSVRAMYLLTAAADLVNIPSSKQGSELLGAIRGLWRNMVDKKMYLTGGIGAMKQYEGFGLDYFLPQGSDEGGCYSETCAAIGVMMLAERLLQIELDGELGDIMELCLYNSVLTAMSHDGKAFTYVNQLASSNQDLSERKDWFTCACCPPNMLRMLGQIGGYATKFDGNQEDQSARIVVHLFLPSTLSFSVGSEQVELSQTSDWPWSGDITFKVQAAIRVELKLRIPAWAESWTLSPECPEATLERGYLTLPAKWLSANPEFLISIPLTTRLISPHPYTRQDIIAVARGPIIYCAEDVDNDWVQDHFKSVQLSQDRDITEDRVRDVKTEDTYIALSITRGASVLDVRNIPANSSITLAAPGKSTAKADTIDELKLIPYYFRANRGGRGQMRVGMMKQWT